MMVSGMSGMLRVVVVVGLGAIAAATELIPQRSSFSAQALLKLSMPSSVVLVYAWLSSCNAGFAGNALCRVICFGPTPVHL